MSTALLKVLIVVNVVLAIAGSVGWALLYQGTSKLGVLVASINEDRNKRTIILQKLEQEDIDIRRRLDVLEQK